MKQTDLMEQTGGEPRHPRLCTATSKRSHEPCRKWAMKGGLVCSTHGGKSPQAMAKAAAALELAEARLRNLAPRAVSELESLVTNASSEAVRLGAANSLVDRAVGKATERISGCGGDHGEASVVNLTFVSPRDLHAVPENESRTPFRPQVRF